MLPFDDLRLWVEAETGMDFSGVRLARLRDAVQRALPRDGGLLRLEQLPALLQGPFLERLTAALTVGESFFFRNEFHFRALREHVVPGILHENVPKREIRVWSAGCAAGEEPYSLAILLDQIVSAGLPSVQEEAAATPAAPGRCRFWEPT